MAYFFFLLDWFKIKRFKHLKKNLTGAELQLWVNFETNSFDKSYCVTCGSSFIFSEIEKLTTIP